MLKVQDNGNLLKQQFGFKIALISSFRESFGMLHRQFTLLVQKELSRFLQQYQNTVRTTTVVLLLE